MAILKNYKSLFLVVTMLANSIHAQEVLCVGRDYDLSPVNITSLEKTINNCDFARANLTENYEDYKKIIDSQLASNLLESIESLTEEVLEVSDESRFSGLSFNEDVSCSLVNLDQEITCGGVSSEEKKRKQKIIQELLAKKMNTLNEGNVLEKNFKNLAKLMKKKKDFNDNVDDCPFNKTIFKTTLNLSKQDYISCDVVQTSNLPIANTFFKNILFKIEGNDGVGHKKIFQKNLCSSVAEKFNDFKDGAINRSELLTKLNSPELKKEFSIAKNISKRCEIIKNDLKKFTCNDNINYDNDSLAIKNIFASEKVNRVRNNKRVKVLSDSEFLIAGAKCVQEKKAIDYFQKKNPKIDMKKHMEENGILPILELYSNEVTGVDKDNFNKLGSDILRDELEEGRNDLQADSVNRCTLYSCESTPGLCSSSKSKYPTSIELEKYLFKNNPNPNLSELSILKALKETELYEKENKTLKDNALASKDEQAKPRENSENEETRVSDKSNRLLSSFFGDDDTPSSPVTKKLGSAEKPDAGTSSNDKKAEVKVDSKKDELALSNGSGVESIMPEGSSVRPESSLLGRGAGSNSAVNNLNNVSENNNQIQNSGSWINPMPMQQNSGSANASGQTSQTNPVASSKSLNGTETLSSSTTSPVTTTQELKEHVKRLEELKNERDKFEEERRDFELNKTKEALKEAQRKNSELERLSSTGQSLGVQKAKNTKSNLNAPDSGSWLAPNSSANDNVDSFDENGGTIKSASGQASSTNSRSVASVSGSQNGLKGADVKSGLTLSQTSNAVSGQKESGLSAAGAQEVRVNIEEFKKLGIAEIEEAWKNKNEDLVLMITKPNKERVKIIIALDKDKKPFIVNYSQLDFESKKLLPEWTYYKSQKNLVRLRELNSIMSGSRDIK